MNNIKKLLPYLLVHLISFYLLPVFIKDTGGAMFVLLIVIPLVSFVTPLIYAKRNSFVWFYPLFVMVIFTPSIFIFYNASATIYILLYGGISLLGNFIGSKL